MKRALLLAVAAVGVFAGCAQALAAATAQATASVEVQDRASVSVLTPLILPTVSTTAVVSASQLSGVTAVSGVSGSAVAASSAGGAGISGSSVAGTAVSGRSGVAGSNTLGNATLTIYGQSGDAVSMAVPETFKVIRTGGTESLTVRTNTQSEYDVAGNGVVLGGGLNANTMSVNVGGSLALASAEHLVPGPYEGLLVVVVQYN